MTVMPRLRAFREAKKWSREKLGNMVGTSGGTIYALEKGIIQNPTWFLVQALADALEVSADEFFLPLDIDESVIPTHHTPTPIEETPA